MGRQDLIITIWAGGSRPIQRHPYRPPRRHVESRRIDPAIAQRGPDLPGNRRALCQSGRQARLAPLPSAHCLSMGGNETLAFRRNLPGYVNGFLQVIPALEMSVFGWQVRRLGPSSDTLYASGMSEGLQSVAHPEPVKATALQAVVVYFFTSPLVSGCG